MIRLILMISCFAVLGCDTETSAETTDTGLTQTPSNQNNECPPWDPNCLPGCCQPDGSMSCPDQTSCMPIFTSVKGIVGVCYPNAYLYELPTEDMLNWVSRYCMHQLN